MKLDKEGITPYNTKKDKFLADLELNDLSNGLAIVPIKYNGHFVTICINLINKKIKLFDSSLYSWFGHEEDKPENEEMGAAFRKFLLEDYENYNRQKIDFKELANIEVALNKENVQGEFDTCGFWTIGFCMEVYKNVENYESLCDCINSSEFLLRIAKRISNIIDNCEQIEVDIGYSLENENERLNSYKIPFNSVCVPVRFRDENINSDHCNKLQAIIDKFNNSSYNKHSSAGKTITTNTTKQAQPTFKQEKESKQNKEQKAESSLLSHTAQIDINEIGLRIQTYKNNSVLQRQKIAEHKHIDRLRMAEKNNRSKMKTENNPETQQKQWQDKFKPKQRNGIEVFHKEKRHYQQHNDSSQVNSIFR